MTDPMLEAIHRYQSDKLEIIRHFSGNRQLALDAIRKQAAASRCSLKVAASLLLAKLQGKTDITVAAIDSEDLQATQRHENDRG